MLVDVVTLEKNLLKYKVIVDEFIEKGQSTVEVGGNLNILAAGDLKLD